MIEIKKNLIPSSEQLCPLYSGSVPSPEAMRSSAIYTAFDGSRLAGILRAVGDHSEIMYIQDLLILPEYQHKGLGRQMLSAFMRDAQSVKQIVLLTDNDEETIEFYRSSGFAPAEERYLAALIRVN
ncbi:MAG: GNAT family N-acetyltransferase [Sphaerochaetaceae bacterium]|jgi:ribosomal protein S18 acetylase RimI-like enzyme|nr:GNAT family N-acetyltransferase [Sphaerochaetaceae bacterium]MDD3163896.1 GNAT family N-acetyltransferase [Sphaerochaetaceae bacterium]MDD4007101.1 GNAT family N-acetyltransferase [Sphaerochaetaceae bacterium]MDD4397383.1 GNAT family N-acetyltransferase [Sphaerochaetaceae bacterium]